MRAEAGTQCRGGQVLAGLLISPPSRQARRTLGTIAWAVLEDVALDAEVDGLGHLAAVTNVRRVAAHLGIGKDTAARALLRLIDAGFVQRQSHRGRGGEFASSTYVLHLDETTGIARYDGPPSRPVPVSGSKEVTKRSEGHDDQAGSQRRLPRRPVARSRPASRRAGFVVQGGLFDSEDRR